MLVLRLAEWQIDALRKGETVPGRVGAEGGRATEVVRIEPPTPLARASTVRTTHVRHLHAEMAATLRRAADKGVQGQESVSQEHVPPTVAEGRVPQGPRQVFAGAYSAHDTAKLAGHRAALLEDQVRAVRDAETPPSETAAARIQRLTAASGATVAEASAAWRTAFGQSEPDPKYAGWALKHRTPPEVRDGDQANTLHLHVRVGPYVLATLSKIAARLQVDLPDVLEEVLVMGCEALEAGL